MSETTPKPSAARSNLYFGVVLILIILIAITVYSGTRTGRFFSIGGLDTAAQRVRQIPTSIGDWVAQDNETLGREEVAALDIDNRYVYRTYENKLTGDSVSFILMVGPTGFLVVHTPETCFGGDAYVKDEKGTTAVAFPAAGRQAGQTNEDRLWKVVFQHRARTNAAVLFYYGIKTDDDDFWRASDYPRSDFQNYPFVYKMQIQAYGPANPEEGEVDAVTLFLRDALPTIRRCLHGDDTGVRQ